MIQHSGVDDSDDENEDDEDEWLDYHQIVASNGGTFFKRKKLSFIKGENNSKTRFSFGHLDHC